MMQPTATAIRGQLPIHGLAGPWIILNLPTTPIQKPLSTLKITYNHITYCERLKERDTARYQMTYLFLAGESPLVNTM